MTNIKKAGAFTPATLTARGGFLSQGQALRYRRIYIIEKSKSSIPSPSIPLSIIRSSRSK